MDQIQHDKIKAKLAKIKALAERGVGGEKETAMRMYEELKARYEIEDEEITLDEVTLHWFSYKNDLEEDLLTQIFFMVTGSASYHRYTGSYSRRKKRGCDCTEVEAAEITLYFNFYKEELKREMEAFMAGFKFKNNLFPDENARCYQEHKGEERERTDEEKKVNRAAVPVDISGIDLKKFWGISFRMALIVYSLNEEQKTCEMCRQVLLQEPECETCSTYKNTKGLQQQFEDLQRQLEKAAVEV